MPACSLFLSVSNFNCLLFIFFLAGTSIYVYVKYETNKVNKINEIQINQPINISGFGGGAVIGLAISTGLK